MAITIYKWTKESSGVYGTFADWITAQGSTPKSVAIGQTITLGAALNIPSTIDIVDIYNGATFSGNYLVTIGRMSCIPRHQIFTGGATALFNSGAVLAQLPVWFGSGLSDPIFNDNISISTGKTVDGVDISALNTNYLTHSGLTDTAHGSYASNVSGQLNTRINNSGAYSANVSGQLDSRIISSGTYAINSSGQLSSRIDATGLYAANVSGQLNDRINATGLYAANVSGQLDSRINNLVPYSGATADLNLGTYRAIGDSFIFNQSPSLTGLVGEMYWDSTEETVSIALNSGVTLSLGTEQYVRAVNKTGAQINDGSLVYISGAQGNRPTMYLANSDNYSTSTVIGMATQNIANNAEGFATTLGVVHGYNTTGFSAGDDLYISNVSGVANKTPPSSGYMVKIGVALNSTANGSVFIKAHHPLSLNLDIANPSRFHGVTESGIYSYGNNVSGQLNTRINNSGAYSANVSGQLNTYITNTSGQLDSRISSLSSSGLSFALTSGFIPKATSGSGLVNSKVSESGASIMINGGLHVGALWDPGNTNLYVEGSGTFVNNVVISGHLGVSGNIIMQVSGTVDGVDVSALNSAAVAHVALTTGAHGGIAAGNHNHGLGTLGFISKYTSTSGFGVSLMYESGSYAVLSGIFVLPKASGAGMMLDTTAPTYGWRDVIGDLTAAAGGAHAPSWVNYSGKFYIWQFDNATGPGEDQLVIKYHIPHDYALGTMVYPHVHWMPSTTATGTVVWGFTYSVSKGHQQGVYTPEADIFATGVIPAGSGRLNAHYITEVASGMGIPSTFLEPDSLVEMCLFRTGSGTYIDNVYANYADLHYQSTNMPTKQKAPNFYV